MEQEALDQLRVLEQGLTATMQQKQHYQKQVLEMENALLELGEAPETYVIVGTVMIKKPVQIVKQDLLEKKETYSVRIETLEKKEQQLREQAKTIQENLLAAEKQE